MSKKKQYVPLLALTLSESRNTVFRQNCLQQQVRLNEPRRFARRTTRRSENEQPMSLSQQFLINYTLHHAPIEYLYSIIITIENYVCGKTKAVKHRRRLIMTIKKNRIIRKIIFITLLWIRRYLCTRRPDKKAPRIVSRSTVASPVHSSQGRRRVIGTRRH